VCRVDVVSVGQWRGEVVVRKWRAGSTRRPWSSTSIVPTRENAHGKAAGAAVGKWMRGGRRSATGVSDLPKSNEALREVSS